MSRTLGSGLAAATFSAKAMAPVIRSPSIIWSKSFVPASFSEGTGLPETIMFSAVSDADHARQPLRAARAGQQAQLDFGQRDLRAGRGHAVVAGERELQTAAHRHRVDRGDHRLLRAPRWPR